MSTKTKRKGNGSIYMNSLITLREEHRYMNYKGVPYYLLALSKRKWKNNNIWPSCRDIPRPAGCGISPLKVEMAPWTQHQGAIAALKMSCSKHEIVKKPLY